MTERQFLIVDHDTALRDAVRRAIDPNAWQGEVALTSKADDAIEAFRAHPTDCILIAAQSPDFDGVELLERLLVDAETDVPIFLVMDEPDEALVSCALAAGALDCLPRSRFMMGALPRVVALTIEKSRLEQALAGSANAAFDDSTGLGNATLLLRDLARAIAAAERAQTAFCLLLMDLKRFPKPGQPQRDDLGSLIPAEFGRRLIQGGRRSDLFYRMGEQRFAALLDNTDVGNCAAFTRRIRQAVLMPFKVDGEVTEVDISMGVAGFPADGKTPEMLMRTIEQLALRAKQSREGIVTTQTPAAKEPMRRRG